MILRIKKKLRKLLGKIYKLPFFKKPLPNYPFGKSIQANKEKYLELYHKAILNEDHKVIDFEKKCGFSINKNWFNKLALHTQVVIKKEELNFFHGRLLYSLLSKYINDENLNSRSSKQIIILETGTARGFSSICMAKALTDNDCLGIITTIDSIPHEKKIYWNCIDDNEGPKSRSELLEKWDSELKKIIFIQGWTKDILPRLGITRINFAFLDAQHTKEDVLREFKFVSERQKEGDIIVFDDVTENLFPGVCEALKFIENNSKYKVKRLNFTSKRGYAIATKYKH